MTTFICQFYVNLKGFAEPKRYSKSYIYCIIEMNDTFSETKLLLPFRSSGAIQGSVPLTPPEMRV
jgi:hypothetical protein